MFDLITAPCWIQLNSITEISAQMHSNWDCKCFLIGQPFLNWNSNSLQFRQNLLDCWESTESLAVDKIHWKRLFPFCCCCCYCCCCCCKSSFLGQVSSKCESTQHCDSSIPAFQPSNLLTFQPSNHPTFQPSNLLTF